MAVVITEQEAIHIDDVLKMLNDPIGSHGIDAIKQLFQALDACGQGIVGGSLDLKNQALIETLLSKPELVRVISMMQYSGYESTTEAHMTLNDFVVVAPRVNENDELQLALNAWPIEDFDAIYFIGENEEDDPTLYGWDEDTRGLIPLMAANGLGCATLHDLKLV